MFAIHVNGRLLRHIAAAGTVTVVAALLLPVRAEAAGNPCGPPVLSVIACENSLPGDPESDWKVSGIGDANLQGYATNIHRHAARDVR